MISRLGFIRYKSYGLFASLLAFEAKFELTKPKPVQASSWPEESWHTFLMFVDVVCIKRLGPMLKINKIA